MGWCLVYEVRHYIKKSTKMGCGQDGIQMQRGIWGNRNLPVTLGLGAPKCSSSMLGDGVVFGVWEYALCKEIHIDGLWARWDPNAKGGFGEPQLARNFGIWCSQILFMLLYVG